MAETPKDVDHALRDLAGVIETPAPSGRLTAAVLDRVASDPVPARSVARIAVGLSADWLRARFRWLVALLVALGCSGVAVSPVGAEVADWFRFHGVVVASSGAPSASEDPDVPPADGGLTLDEAAALVDFPALVPALLGAPDDVSVSTDRRKLSMSWEASGPGSGTTRLDQFAARLAPQFWKAAHEAVFVSVGNHEGLWIAGPHHVVVLDESGNEKSVPPRLAAQTLIWMVGGRTFRLEGDLTRAQAVEIAESTS